MLIVLLSSWNEVMYKYLSLTKFHNWMHMSENSKYRYILNQSV